MAAGSRALIMSFAFLQLGFAITVWEADTAEKCSIAAAPFDKPSCVTTGAGLLALAAITTNHFSTGFGTDREADTAGRTSRHATAAQLHMLAAIPVATVLDRHVEKAPTATRIVVLTPTEELVEGDILIVMGKDEDIQRLDEASIPKTT